MRGTGRKLAMIPLGIMAVAVGFFIVPGHPIRGQQQVQAPTASRNLLIINGDVYELIPYRGPVGPAPPVPGPAPAPAPPRPPDPIPDPPPPNSDGAVPKPADELAKLARDYIYVIPAFHRRVGKEAKDGTIKTRGEAFKRGNQLRDFVGVPFGKAVDEAVAKSGSTDASGNITDPAKFDAVMQHIAEAQEAIIRNP